LTLHHGERFIVEQRCPLPIRRPKGGGFLAQDFVNLFDGQRIETSWAVLSAESGNPLVPSAELVGLVFCCDAGPLPETAKFLA